MKIVFVVSASLPVPPVKGGAVESLVYYLLEENEREKNFHFVVISPYDIKACEEAKKFKETDFFFIKIPIWKSLIEEFCSKIIFKLFHKSIPLMQLAYAGKAKKYIQKKYKNADSVIVENNIALIDIIAKIQIPLFYHLHNDSLNIDIPDADKILYNCEGVIAVSEFIKNRVATISGGEDKCRVLLNCTDTEKFNAGLYQEFRLQYRNSKGIKYDDIVLAFAGRLHPTKGLRELLLAFNKIKSKNIYLMIMGGIWFSSNKTDTYVEEVKTLALDKRGRVVWTGYIAHEDMPKYYACADIAVFPSIWDEPGSLAVLEAEASGLPLIVTKSGGIPENTNTKAALFVSKDDKEYMVEELAAAIMKLAEDSDLRLKMSEEGLAYMGKRGVKDYYIDFKKLMEGWKAKK